MHKMYIMITYAWPKVLNVLNPLINCSSYYSSGYMQFFGILIFFLIVSKFFIGGGGGGSLWHCEYQD